MFVVGQLWWVFVFMISSFLVGLGVWFGLVVYDCFVAYWLGFGYLLVWSFNAMVLFFYYKGLLFGWVGFVWLVCLIVVGFIV